MNSTKPVPDQPTYEIAGFTDRVFARIVDGFLMSCILLVTWIPVALFAWFILPADAAAVLFLLAWVAVMLPVVLYEVHPTARRGSAVGKKIAEISVIRWSAFNDAATCQPFPSYGQSLIRWLVPHSVLFAGVVVEWLWSASHDSDTGIPLFYCTGLAGWVLLYLTSLLDKDGRGWHDKAAGTVVVKAPRTDSSE